MTIDIVTYDIVIIASMLSVTLFFLNQSHVWQAHACLSPVNVRYYFSRCACRHCHRRCHCHSCCQCHTVVVIVTVVVSVMVAVAECLRSSHFCGFSRLHFNLGSLAQLTVSAPCLFFAPEPWKFWLVKTTWPATLTLSVKTCLFGKYFPGRVRVRVTLLSITLLSDMLDTKPFLSFWTIRGCTGCLSVKSGMVSSLGQLVTLFFWRFLSINSAV